MRPLAPSPNVDASDLIRCDLQHLWHPCTQMKDHEQHPPVLIQRADGPYLFTHDGRKIIDAISSWWCKSLGHAHPEIRRAVTEQLQNLEHIMLAGATHAPIIRLAQRLATLTPSLDRVFFTDNGSTGVDAAMKMALQYQLQCGRPARTRFLALQNGYHGETTLALAAGDCDLYSAPYAPVLTPIHKIGPLPYVSGSAAEGWNKMDDAQWQEIETQLAPWRENTAALILEPLLQGAGGMLIYSADLLRRLRNWTEKNKILLIADEIMTGMGRTGYALAEEQAGVVPDLAILSKGLTAGWVPMAAILTSTKIYNAFYDDYFSGRAFLHSNTYTGNAIAVAAANAALDIYESEETFARVQRDAPFLRDLMQKVADETGCLRHVRGLGFMVAADLINPRTGEPLPREQRTGYRVYHQAVRLGAWLRPLGDTLYFLPPLNTPKAVLEDLAAITIQAIRATLPTF